MRETIYKRINISIAHRLILPYESKCQNLHGHNYRIECWLYGKSNEDGMIIDFTELKNIIMEYDHCNLNDKMNVNPTAENLVKEIAKKILNKTKTELHSVRIRAWETETAYAEVQIRKDNGGNEYEY